MKPTFFSSPARFRAWLVKHHRSATELLVGFHRKETGKPSITWPESVDQALCFGWIDGVRKRLDDTSYTIRFTPRRPGSNWSAINIRKVEALLRDGLMVAAGLTAYAGRLENNSRIYSYEQRYSARLSPSEARRFRANPPAWKFFQAQAPSYRQTVTYWVTTAKKDETRARRLARLISQSARGRRL